jgi:3-deoxy-D-manno-octulosonic-acid transferase
VNLLWGAYRAFAPFVGTLAPAARMFTSPSERVLWGERLGGTVLPGRPAAWVHAASLGEAVAAQPLVRELERRAPGARFQLTTSTRSGRERLRDLGHDAVLAPLDTPQAVRRFWSGVRPARLFLLETELWPHWLLRARVERVPVAVVSARLSERSLRGYLRLGEEFRDLVHGLAAVLCQGAEDQARWLALGASPERTSVVGNLKSDGLPEPSADRGAARSLLGLDGARPLLVIGNLRPGETRVVVRAWRGVSPTLRGRWQVVAVPRHSRALAQIQAEAIAAGLTDMAHAAPSDAWRWDARLGVLTAWYRAADVAFVGGSLAPYGGHNPMEPAACGAAVVMGTYDHAQREGVRALEQAGGLWRVADAAALTHALETLFANEDLRHTRSMAALRVAAAERGSAERAVTRLEDLELWPVS